MNRSITITEQELQNKIKDKAIKKAIWLDNEKQLVVSEICSLLINACRFSVNANAYICADDINTAKKSGLAIVEIIESVPGLADSVLCLSIDQFLYTEWEKSKESKTGKYVFIPELVAATKGNGVVDEKATEKICSDLKNKLEKMESDSWKYSVILCADARIDEELRKFEEDASRLYYYLLGNNKLYLKESNAREIWVMICQLLENQGFELAEGFRRKLEIYIEAVYEGAVYKGDKFADDCVNRILREHCKKLTGSTTLSDVDVPYSKKADSLWTEIQQKENEDRLKDADRTLIENVKRCNEANENGVEEIKGNAGIFLALSPINPKNSLLDYEDKSEEACEGLRSNDVQKYEGIQTNDAPIQCLIDKVYRDHYNLKKIVCLTTEKTKEGTEAFNRFRAFVKEYVQKRFGKDKIDVSSILYKSEESEDLTYYHFYRELNKQVESLNAFYVDYTGGLRDTSFLMVAAIRFLEFKDIKCEKVVYSDLYSKKIKSLDKAYGLFQMINGMSEFVSIGTTRQLDDEFGEENELIPAIRRFAHATNVGDIANIDGYVTGLNNALSVQDVSQNLKSIMIHSMKEVIQKKIFGETTDTKLIENNEVNYYRLIDWCIENKMYQQAATLYIEKVPIVYYREGIITDSISDRGKVKGNMGSSKDAAAFYTKLPKWLIQPSGLEQVEKCISEIRELSKTTSLNASNYEAFKRQMPEKFKTVDKSISDRFIDIIERVYPEYKKSESISEPIPECFKEKASLIIPKNVNTFITGTEDNDKLLYYLLEGNLWTYKHLNPPSSNDKTRNMNAINEVYSWDESKGKTNDDKSLCILIAFYLAIKILRNKMSHAAETGDNDSEIEKKLEKFLNSTVGKDIKKNNIIKDDIKITLEEEHINNLLKCAMHYTKAAPKFKRREPASEKTVGDAKKRDCDDIDKKIRSIPIPNVNGNETFKLYVQIVVYVLCQRSDKSGKLCEIQEYVKTRNGSMRQLPEKRELSADGKMSGIKLIKASCGDIIRVEGEGQEAVLKYIGQAID